MSYQVLARKYRPQNFDQVVGQEHVTTTLKNAILKQRIHHAYLFTGVRGTGKTSLARIFAKSLQCEKGPTPNPCDWCSNCQSIMKGNFLDVIEIDGASNTSVDSVRELREQVKYMPASGRYKIYIIDEVHMLSTSAFNALLKTLEEPPAHVLFLFATTEAHKIPVTILSRCQRFDLRRLSQGQINGRLKDICSQEKVSSDGPSLDLLSRAAEGSMRDAQSLLDMAIGLCGAALQADKIQEMLGLTEWNWIADLTAHCLQGNLQAALAQVDDLYQRGYDLRQVANQWVEYLHALTLLKSAGEVALGGAYPADQLKMMKELSAGLELPALQVAFQILYRGSEEIFRSESPKILFDLMVVKWVYGNPYMSLGQAVAGSPAASVPVGQAVKVVASQPAPTLADTRAPSEPEVQAPMASAPVASEEVLQRALRKRPAIKAILDHAMEKWWEGHAFCVAFEKGSIYPEIFLEKKSQLAEALGQELGTQVTVKVVEKPGTASAGGPAPSRQKGSAPPLPDDPVIQQAVEILNATVQEVKKAGL